MGASDGQRVLSVLGGDRSAFEGLYDRHAGWVRAMLYDTTRDLPAAQDLAQEAFLRAYRHLGDLREPEKFGSWLMGIARNVARDWLRQASHGRGATVDCDPETVATPRDGHDLEDVERLREAVQSLPEQERLAVYVFYLQERSAEDARNVLNLSRAGLYRVLARARQHLERIMRREWENAR